MAKALQNHVGEIVHLGPDGSLLTRAIERTGGGLNRVGKTIFSRCISPDHHRILSWRLARTFNPRVAQLACDVIFAPFASIEIYYLSTDTPIIYLSDLTWANMVNYYQNVSSMFVFAKAEGECIEAAAIGKASALIYPSKWVAGTAIEHYKADAQKVYCIPFGANFEKTDIPSRESALQHALLGGVILLWVGVDWHRKGGVVAWECLIELLSRGLDAKMVVCGCVPPERYHHPKIEIIPFLSKRDPAQRHRLSQLFLDANFFIFPTLADASPIVLCEASAHGLPSLVRDTGGVAGAVMDGENGYLLPPDATGKQYAEKILDLVQDHGAYDKLVLSSRMAYEEKLNWDAWGRAVRPIFERVVEDSSNRRAV